MTMIAAAAIKTRDGKVWVAPRPGRHDLCFRMISKALGETDNESETERERWLDYTRDDVQGFVTDVGEFLDREQAYELVKKTGQLETFFIRAHVVHKVHGRGRVLHLEPITTPPGLGRDILGKRFRVHVKFDDNPDQNLWFADDELKRSIIGGVLTSEDLW